MAPETRSRASGGTSRVSYYEPPPPPSPPAKASTSKTKTTKKTRVYRRSDPAPQQVRFPGRQTTIRTYGKNRRSLPSKPPNQSTLTQIGWIPSTYQDEDDEEDIERFYDPTTVDDENDNWNMEERKRRSKRRKTTGDIVPVSTANSSYHTQTLTQMPLFMSGQQPEDDELEGDFDFNVDEELNGPANVAFADEIYEATPDKRKKDQRPSVPKGKSQSSLPPRSPTGSIVAQTQTPRKQIVERAVIPSSQPSPFTPNFGIADRYLTDLDRTPLQEKSTNVDAPTPTATGKKRPRTLEIADSWSTVNGGMGSSPLKERQRVHRTPLKEIFLGDMADVGVDLGGSLAAANDYIDHQSAVADGVIAGAEDAGATSQKSSSRPAEEIILDSDDELGFELEDGDPDDETVPGTPTPIYRASGTNAEAVSLESAGLSIPSAPKVASQPSSQHVTQRNSSSDPPTENDEVEPETPSPSPQRRPSISSAVEAERETPLSSPQKTSPAMPAVPSQLGSRHKSRVLTSPQKTPAAMPPVSQLGYRYKSQAFESQRVPFEKIRQLGPQTDRSDIILSVHPEQAEQIAEGIKTHEFRNYRIPQTVSRIWIYVTRPACELMYMAPISAAKQPGDISPDDRGLGNNKFNEGTGTKFAYELKQVYELNNPVSLARMKENGWVEEAPAKYVYVPPAVLGELLGNLRCALFTEPGELQTSQVDMSVSQEVAMQLHGDIAHSTQLNVNGSSQPQRGPSGGNDDDEDAVPSSPAEDQEHGNEAIQVTGAPSTDEVVFAKPTIPPSRSQRSVHWIEDSPVAGRSQRSQRAPNSTAVRPSQATTASGPSSPSQQLLRPRPRQTRSQQASIPLSPPMKSVRRRELVESSSMPAYPEDMVIVGDSPVRRRDGGAETQTSLLLGSSQGFTLGEEDSLLDDSRVRQPPDIVWDSEGEIE
ncbi:hypothetical protein VSDG_01227 [Cytospora chrysosperma]|uniref:Uncharacterized protein n=1 Tax=Cytospora chrysosperma TaxID=252740 RepID=A0A423WJ64_CYTCH|nr:hypothetical protein VSDG_01227 [Valsa sordida]